MNLFSLYAKIGLDDSEYTQAVKRDVKYSDSLKSEMKKLDTQVADLTKQYRESVSESGRYSDQTEKLAEQLEEAKKRQAELKDELDKTRTAANKTSISLSDVGSALKTGATVAAGFATAIVGGLAAASAATEEYRVGQGKLNTAYESAGYSADTAKQAYSDFYKILGDNDRAVEASQLLAKLAENEEDVSTWTNIAAGVWGTFGDSLPIEGLVEATNETVKVGQVTGVLADALNWVGISEDEFNEKLEAAGDESERNQLIMEALAGTYDSAADSFYKNNETIIQNRESQQKMTETLAKLGEQFDRIKNKLVEIFSPAIEEAGEQATEFLEGIDVEEAVENIEEFARSFEDAIPFVAGLAGAVFAFKTMMGIAALIQGVSTAITGFKAANEAATISQAALNAVMNMNPFILIATLIAGVVAALVTLWMTNENFRTAVIEIWAGIQEFLGLAIETVTGFFQSLVEFVAGLPEEIQQTFNDIVDRALQLGSDIVEKIKTGISDAWSGLTSWFNGIWNSLFSDRSVDVSVNGSSNVDGSHRSGLSYVPFDGYIAELHKGEQVLTANEASDYRAGKSGGGVTIIQNIYSEARTAADLMLEAKHQQERAVLFGV